VFGPAGKIPIAESPQQPLHLPHRIADAKLSLYDMPNISRVKRTDTIIFGWPLIYTLPEPLKLVGIETSLGAAARLILQSVKAVSVVRVYPVLDDSPSILAICGAVWPIRARYTARIRTPRRGSLSLRKNLLSSLVVWYSSTCITDSLNNHYGVYYDVCLKKRQSIIAGAHFFVSDGISLQIDDLSDFPVEF
jgi:hypothetical protein